MKALLPIVLLLIACAVSYMAGYRDAEQAKHFRGRNASAFCAEERMRAAGL